MILNTVVRRLASLGAGFNAVSRRGFSLITAGTCGVQTMSRSSTASRSTSQSIVWDVPDVAEADPPGGPVSHLETRELPQSLPRNACFNCGEFGHRAANCFAPRKCNLCGAVGHIARQCPTFSTAGQGSRKQRNACYNCGAIGHTSGACPKPEMCHLCGGTGHIARDCPDPAAVVNAAVPGSPMRTVALRRHLFSGPAAQRCFNCGDSTHQVKDCPNPPKCHRCGDTSHLAKDCTLQRACFKCGDPSHMAKDCHVPQGQALPSATHGAASTDIADGGLRRKLW